MRHHDHAHRNDYKDYYRRYYRDRYGHHHGDTKRHAPKIVLFGLALAAAAGVGYLVRHKQSALKKETAMSVALRLTSPAFDNGERIPVRYTCKGDNVSPPLEFSGIPTDAQSLALILHDPDAPSGDYLHWAIWNIHPGITNIPEGAVPIGAVEGKNDFGDTGYGGPCPPSGTHRYEFDAYALDANLKLPAGSERSKVMQAIEDHTIAETKLVGSFGVGG
jgi:Raf kinase inhibitor-like YbhB/YbcL family protein